MGFEYICKCGNCDALLYDDNPKDGAIQLDEDKITNIPIYRPVLIKGEPFYTCPKCGHDASDMTEQVDYFEYQHALPEDIRLLIEKYSKDELTYQECEAFHQEALKIGYTFEWYLDAVPFDLRKTI